MHLLIPSETLTSQTNVESWFSWLPPQQIFLLLMWEEGPLPGPEPGLLSNTWKSIVLGDTCADKARDFIGKGHSGGEQ